MELLTISLLELYPPMGASSSASSTPDYDVSSTAAFDVASTSQINQAIGSLQIGDVETTIDPTTN